MGSVGRSFLEAGLQTHLASHIKSQGGRDLYELQRFSDFTTHESGKQVLTSLGDTRVLYTPLLSEVVKKIVDQCQYMLEVTVFTLDLEFVSHLCRARARGCEVKVLLDLQQCLEPSCTHHAAALNALRVGDVAMR